MKFWLKMFNNNLLVLSLCLVIIGWTTPALAQVVVTDGNLEVTFAQTPLFGAPGESNLAPGVSTQKTVTVRNIGTEPETVIANVQNESSTGLAEQSLFTIADTDTAVYFNDLMSIFFQADFVTLGTLAGGDGRQYILSVLFDETSGNTYQGATMGFDLLFGFASGATVSTGGGGGGGGTTSGGFIPQPTPGAPNTLPDGQIAGAATSNVSPTNSWWEPFVDWATGTVAGSAASTESGAQVGASLDEQVDATSSARTADTAESLNEVATEPRVAGSTTQAWCTFLWLLLLAILSLITSVADDLLQHRGSIFRTLFKRQLVFSLGYSVLVGVAYYVGIIDETWWLLAGMWLLAQGVDIYAHTKHVTLWRPRTHFMVMGGGAVLLIGVGMFTDSVCIWWPFVVVALLSLLSYFVVKTKQ